jgi:hypothetical protein
MELYRILNFSKFNYIANLNNEKLIYYIFIIYIFSILLHAYVNYFCLYNYLVYLVY